MPPRLVDAPFVFLGRDALASGMRPSLLRSAAYRRPLRGTYAPAAAPDDHVLRCAAAGLLLPPGAQITGASAAALHGLTWLRGTDQVEAVAPETGRLPRVDGLAVRRSSAPLPPGRPWASTTVAAPPRLAFDAAARAPLPLAVARLDALVRARVVTVEGTTAFIRGSFANDVARVREALALVDPRAESLPESQLRVVLHTAGLPVVPQHVVADGERFVARLDLALVEERVAVEYDGAWHALREQLQRDRARLNELSALGWAVVHVTAADLRQPDRVVALVRAEASRQRRRLGLPGARRSA